MNLTNNLSMRMNSTNQRMTTDGFDDFIILVKLEKRINRHFIMITKSIDHLLERDQNQMDDFALCCSVSLFQNC